jgi:glutathione synthase/RimK-type ligase-like ATP-grasp enzyme
VLGEAAYYKNRFDTKGSEWINLLYGLSKSIITNKLLLHENFQGAPYLVDSIIFTKTVPKFTGLKILKPFGGFKGDGILITENHEESQTWVENSKYTQWLLQPYLKNPALFQNHKFHFRIFVLVVITDIRRVYVSSVYFYRVAEKKYVQGDWDDADIHDTHYNKEFEKSKFPDELPDGWTTQDIKPKMNEINQMFTDVFKNHHEFKPEWNAKNGFELFGADIMFSNKKAYVLEINSKIGYGGQNPIIPGIIETVLENKENKHFTKLI